MVFKKFIPFVFLAALFCLIVSSLLPQEVAHTYFYQAAWFKVLWAVLSIGLVFTTVNFLKKKEFSFTAICLGLILILFGGFWGSFLGVEGFIEIKEGQMVDGFWIEDDLFQPLDFSLFLKDFSVEFHPKQKKGMRFVKSYKSTVRIAKDATKVLKEGIIEVNKPLRFEGFSFYQYGYAADLPNQTILQVVKDPGLPFVYGGFALLLIGMILSFKKVFFII